MTIEDFASIVSLDTHIKVFDMIGYAGRFEPYELVERFAEDAVIVKMWASDYNVISIMIKG